MAKDDDEGGDQPDFDDDDIELMDSIWDEIGEPEGDEEDE